MYTYMYFTTRVHIDETPLCSGGEGEVQVHVCYLDSGVFCVDVLPVTLAPLVYVGSLCYI